MRKLWWSLLGLLLLEALFSTIQAECDFEKLFGDDAEFCSPDLHVIYPGLGDASCLFVPNCFDFHNGLTKIWTHPRIKYSKAQKGHTYILIMVDPDAPKRYDPKYKYWRHWLVTDIQGGDLLTGNIETGNNLSAYSRPNPPSGTGYHRYQFLLYRQPSGKSPSLLPKESHLGSWDLDAFVKRFKLGTPLATTQFMARNPTN
ncbi:phosphatidylethanolamine-binding protein 4 [Rhinophrynus dorsalis]